MGHAVFGEVGWLIAKHPDCCVANHDSATARILQICPAAAQKSSQGKEMPPSVRSPSELPTPELGPAPGLRALIKAS